MKKNKSIERIAFLAEKFNVFTNDEYKGLIEKDGVITVYGNEIDREVIALYTVKMYDNGDLKVDDHNNTISNWIGIHENVFINMVQSDPTVNKIYVQWMLSVFTNYLKKGQRIFAKRFACEDLPQAKEYLELFDANKYKKAFKRICSANFAFNNITDPSNINQYKNLSQLFDAVDPYIERDVSNLERGLVRFVKSGEAEIPFKDRNFTVYTPFTKEASAVLSSFTSWCTSKLSYSNHEGYTNQKTPMGTKSKLYVIFDNNFFLPEEDPNHSDGLWQLHVESGQLQNKSNSSEPNFVGKVLDKSEGISEYFYDLLIKMARMGGDNISKNVYASRLINFGFSDILFEIIGKDVDKIQFQNQNLRKIPDMTKFKNLSSLYLYNVKLEELHDSVSKLKKLNTLSLPNNKLKTIPRGVCYLKNLTSINLVGNNIESLPDELGKLDRKNGGGLIRIAFGKKEVSKEILAKARRLLPTTEIVEFDNTKG